MRNSSNSKPEGKIIDFKEAGEAIVEKVVEGWYLGNRECDNDLIESSRKKLERWKDIFPIAKYFAGIVKIQLRDDRLEENITNVFQALEVLLNESEFNPGQLLKSCREMLLHLSEREKFFECNYEMPLIPTLEEVKQVVAEINRRGIQKQLLAELFAYIEAFQGGEYD